MSKIEGFGYKFYIPSHHRSAFLSASEQPDHCVYESSPMTVLWGLIETGDEAVKDAATALMEQLNAGEIIDVAKQKDSSGRLEFYLVACRGFTDKGRRFFPSDQPTPEEPEAAPLKPTRRLRFPKR